MVKITLPMMLLAAAGSSCVMAFTPPALMSRLAAGKAGMCATGGLRSGVRMMALPEGWQQVKDPASGDFYYYNANTGATQWEAPAALATSAARAAPAKSVAPGAGKFPAGTKFDVKEFEATGRIVPLEDQGEPRGANPLLKVASAGMGLIKPLFAAEASLQAAALGGIAKVSADDVVAEIEAQKQQSPCLIYTYKLSPFSSEALALLEASGYQYTNIELGLEWFTLGGRASQTRVALAGMCENGATSLPKIFIGGKSIGGASGFSALASLVDDGKLEPMLKAAGVPKK